MSPHNHHSIKKVAVGLSGGVDSAVSAFLLQDAGYDVTCVFLECYNTPGCRTDADHQDALEVALALHLPFKVLDFKQAYQEKVISYFRDAYAAGFTPNPDVVCNREIKFGLFYDWAMSEGYDFMATGHYARVQHITNDKSKNTNKTVRLFQATDKQKDQSYFLCQLKAEQLAQVLFPIGHLTKSEVRELAQKHSLPVAAKPDSQGICFIGEVSVKKFLKNLGLSEKSGDVLFEDAIHAQTIIGQHEGAWFYTLGQRLGISQRAAKKAMVSAGLDPSHLPPLFVVAKDISRNQLVVGVREQLITNHFKVAEIHWMNKEYELGSKNQAGSGLRVRIRHLGELVSTTIHSYTSYSILQTSQPLYGVAPGQIAVFYDGEAVAGWATIA